jgi:ATP-dependent Lon protease
MKESVTTALSWIKSNRNKLLINGRQLLSDIGIDQDEAKDRDFMELIDIHIHFPSAGIPKDGPSAGVTICSALVRILFTDR